MLNSMLMLLNSIIGLILIVLATNVNKNLSGCNPSQKLINCLQGLTIVGTIMFIAGLSFLLASFKCKGCGDLVMPSLYYNIAFYFILGVTLVALAAIIKTEDSSHSCSSSVLTTPIIILGVLMFVAAISLFIFILTPYGRVFMKAKQGYDQVSEVIATVSAPVIGDPEGVPAEGVQEEQRLSFSSCRLPRRRHH